jgi:hypothetical protein
MVMVVIDKGVAIPNEGINRIKYPFASMASGDSFFIPESHGKNTKHIRASISQAAIRYRRKKNGRFTVRTVLENGNPGVRCWRIDGTDQDEYE